MQTLGSMAHDRDKKLSLLSDDALKWLIVSCTAVGMGIACTFIDSIRDMGGTWFKTGSLMQAI